MTAAMHTITQTWVLGMSKLEYRPLTRSQECFWCVNNATQEVVRREGNITAISRCCDDPNCMWLAAERCERTVAA